MKMQLSAYTRLTSELLPFTSHDTTKLPRMPPLVKNGFDNNAAINWRAANLLLEAPSERPQPYPRHHVQPPIQCVRPDAMS